MNFSFGCPQRKISFLLNNFSPHFLSLFIPSISLSHSLFPWLSSVLIVLPSLFPDTFSSLDLFIHLSLSLSLSLYLLFHLRLFSTGISTVLFRSIFPLPTIIFLPLYHSSYSLSIVTYSRFISIIQRLTQLPISDSAFSRLIFSSIANPPSLKRYTHKRNEMTLNINVCCLILLRHFSIFKPVIYLSKQTSMKLLSTWANQFFCQCPFVARNKRYFFYSVPSSFCLQLIHSSMRPFCDLFLTGHWRHCLCLVCGGRIYVYL